MLQSFIHIVNYMKQNIIKKKKNQLDALGVKLVGWKTKRFSLQPAHIKYRYFIFFDLMFNLENWPLLSFIRINVNWSVILFLTWKCFSGSCYSHKPNFKKIKLPLIGLISPFEWWDEALEFGVVETLDSGEPGFISFGVVFPAVWPSVFIDDGSDELFTAFCCAWRSCFRNFALRFWNQTWKKKCK